MISLENFYIGIMYDYTSTKFFFTVKQPIADIITDSESLTFHLEIDDVISETPFVLLYKNGMKLGDQYVWQDLIASNNQWKDYLKLHVGEEIEVKVHCNEDVRTYNPTLYYRSDEISRGISTVNLPNYGWEIGAYDIEVVYPPNHYYDKSITNTQLAYKTWNWPSKIECEGAKDGRITVYPTDSTELIFNVTDKNDKPINTGYVEVAISDIYAESQIYAQDLTVEEGNAAEMDYTITTVALAPEYINSGQVIVNEEIQSIEITGDTSSTQEWTSTQAIATADTEYIPASSSNNIISSGKNCVTHWKVFTLLQNTFIRFVISGQEEKEYSVGLIDTTTERALFTVKHNVDGTIVILLENETITTTITLPNDTPLYFIYEFGKIYLQINDQKTEICTAENTYYMFIQGYDGLGELQLKAIRGGYGDGV